MNADRVWMKKSGVRNEALDEMVYSYASLQRLYQIYDRRTIWKQLENRRDQALKKAGKDDLIENKPVESPYRPPQRQLKKSNPSFVNSW